MNKRRLNKAAWRIQHLPANRFLLLYIRNKLKHFYFKSIKSTTVAFPSTVMIELSNHCNLHCITCPREYSFGENMDKGYMPLNNAKKIVDELWPYLDSIGLTGMGETFMYSDIEEIVDYIKSKNKGIIISTSTNAMLPDFIQKVQTLVNKIDTIQVSIDGLDETYEKIRKNARFQILDDNLRTLVTLCRNTSTTIMLNMVVTKDNYHQMPALVEYTEKTGIKYLDFTLFNLASVTETDSSYYDFYKSDEFQSALRELDKITAKKKRVTVTGRNFKTGNSFQKCPFPWTHFYICWNGYVTPCCAKPFPKELNFGNVFDSNVIDVLNSNEFKQWRELWFKNSPPDFCHKCNFIDLEPIN